jgi:feruloyl esterase
MHMATGRLWIASAVLKDSASFIPTSKYPMIHNAVINACDAADGVKDGLIDDPRQCRFDPNVLLCKNGDGPNCLTGPQVAAAKKIMSPVTNPRTGAEIYPRLEPGSELEWGRQASGPEPYYTSLERLKYVVFQNPAWDWKTFDFDQDVIRLESLDKGNATDPNLKSFVSHGGKLLLYHGWADQSIAPSSSIKYYNSVLGAMGGAEKTSGWMRLFMVPGMNHCGGGEGPNAFDAVGALEQWVEKGKAPNQIIASHRTNGKVDRTRPLCPYPQVAKYKGSGSIDDAAKFVCK